MPLQKGIPSNVVRQEKKERAKSAEAHIRSSPLSTAVRTGLEPATSCVTGRHSNQLN